jgi:predicted transcriptional regulator
MSRAKKGERITVSLSGPDHAALAELADRHDVSLSWLVRQAVTEFLERSASGEVQPPLRLGPGKGKRKE